MVHYDCKTITSSFILMTYMGVPEQKKKILENGLEKGYMSMALSH